MGTPDGGSGAGDVLVTAAVLVPDVVGALPRCMSGVVTSGGEAGATGTAAPCCVAWPDGVTTACAAAKVEIKINVTMNRNHRFIRGSQGRAPRGQSSPHNEFR